MIEEGAKLIGQMLRATPTQRKQFWKDLEKLAVENGLAPVFYHPYIPLQVTNMKDDLITINPALEVFCDDDFFTVIDDMPDTEDVDDYPQYGVPGRILFEVIPGDDMYDDEIEVLDYDGETSIYWMQEGLGIDYWLEHESGIKLSEMSGKYLVVANGRYIKGQDWRQSPEPYDDDEEWWIEEAPVKTDLESLM